MGHRPPKRIGIRAKLVAASAAVASLAVTAGAQAGGGGVETPEPPKLSDVQCLSDCAGRRKATYGSKVELLGRRLGNTETVSFPADAGDLPVTPLRVRSRSVKALVPTNAVTGAPEVSGTSGSATSPEVLAIVGPDQIPDEGEFTLRSANADPGTVFYDGTARASVDYTFAGSGPTDVRVEVVRIDSGRIVDSWVQQDREPYAANTASWDGIPDGGGKAPNGKYRFELSSAGGDAPETTEDARFFHYDHKFPVRGAHSYGDGIGAGRGHQGVDVFASCGTELQAARGGRVQHRQYHSAAGYYLVIDGKGTGRDYVYMHMKRDGRPAEGSRVRTGEKIGYVSDTGNASGCHLHFEVWSAPGWYEGGHFTDPWDDLKSWDAWS